MRYKQIAQQDGGPELWGCLGRGPENSQNAPRDVVCINLLSTIFLWPHNSPTKHEWHLQYGHNDIAGSISNDFPTSKNALPHIRPLGFYPIIHDRTRWKESGFEHLVKQGIPIMEKLPNLLSKESKVEIFNISKSQTTLIFRETKFIPSQPVCFTLIASITPLEFANERLNFFTQAPW